LQARTEFAAALNQLASEKGVDVTVVIEAIEQAALAAYRKDLSLRGEEIPEDFESLTAKINPASGEISIMRGEENITPPGFARIAAQTAKQVIMQRLNEAEKGAIMDEYGKKVGTVISGTIQRQEGTTYFVDLGRAEGILPISEQTRDEYYHVSQRLKFYIKEIREGKRGPEVVVSRYDPELVKGLFALEVPEVQTGSVVIKDVAREAGTRTKLSAISTQDGVDPVGSLVGQKGVRVQAVMNELGEERIDIISYSEDAGRYIAAALSPAKDVTVIAEEKDGGKVAKVKVPTSQLSLAIGKGGQNVRLAAKLTGWKIDIEGTGEGIGEVKETVFQAPTQVVADVVEETQKELTKDEQPIPTNETAKKEGKKAVVDATQPEPTAEEAAPVAAQAEADISEDDAEKTVADKDKKSDNR
ncbi:MAG: transcription termination factor NusA, partial [Candidatus Daviesbacteria bacterium]